MMGLGRAVGAVGAVLGLGAGVVFGAPHAREAGLLPERVMEAQPGPAVESAPVEATAFSVHMDRYVSPENLVAPINALCGFPNALMAEQSYLHMGTDGQTRSLSVFEASGGEVLSYERRSAPAGSLYAYEEFGELVLQTDGERFSTRVHVVEPDGEYGFSGPLEAKRYHRLTCADAAGAAQALNAIFEANGSDTDPGRGKVRSFAVTSIWEVGDTLVDFLDACTPTELYQELPVGRPILIDARFQPDGAYGNVEHEMSGESLEGTPTQLLNLTIAEMFEGNAANILNYAAPVEWSDLPTSTHGFGPSYRYGAVHAIGFSIEPDGSQSHSQDLGGVDFVDIPCSNVEAARAILDALRAGTYVAPRDMERG